MLFFDKMLSDMKRLILLIGIAVQSGIAIHSYAHECGHMTAMHEDKECTPFEAHYEGLKKLSSGNVVQIKSGILYRDSKCRQRTEDRLEVAPGEVVTFVDIDNPVEQTSHTLCIESKTIFYKSVLSSEEFSVWIFNVGGGPDIGLPLVPPQHPPDFEPRQIEGLLCHGYLLRVSPGYVIEYWYSVDLNYLILVRIPSDEGEYTWRLFNIRLAQPSNSLFTIPLDYKYARRED